MGLFEKVFSANILIPLLIGLFISIIKIGINEYNSTTLERKLNKNIINFQLKLLNFFILFIIYFLTFFVLISIKSDQINYEENSKELYIGIIVLSVLIALFVRWFSWIISIIFIRKNDFFVNSTELSPNDGKWKLIRNGKNGYLVKHSENKYRILKSIEKVEFVEKKSLAPIELMIKKLKIFCRCKRNI